MSETNAVPMRRRDDQPMPQEASRASTHRLQFKAAEAVAQNEIQQDAGAFLTALSENGMTSIRLTPQLAVALLDVWTASGDAEKLVAAHKLRGELDRCVARWVERRAEQIEAKIG